MANSIEAAVFNSANQVTHWDNDCELGSATMAPTSGSFNQQSLSYQQIVKVQSSTPHFMRSFTIASGPGKGYRVLVLTPDSPCPLLRLPIEIRDMIYEYVLSEPATVELKFFLKWPGNQRIVQKSFPTSNEVLYLPDKVQREYDNKLEKWKTKHRNALSLLLLNQQISAEAIKILYGANSFRFASPEVLRHFLTKLTGRNKIQYLRHVRFAEPEGKATVTTLREVLEIMELVPHLRSLQFLVPKSWIEEPQKLLKLCEPLLQKALASGQNGAISRRIEHLLSSFGCTCVGCKHRRISGLSAAKVQAIKNPNEKMQRLRCTATKTRIQAHDEFWKEFRALVKAKYGTGAAGAAISA
ncbi:unnamed protein product [Zymoseptoria tritici ST99CH_1E4]|uniref:DUF7730 domain-containing protein n=1 Tax=Zymoseptoria tritici ST99CH_1E4 TaxID=1276532 RepID=A0A2H1H010_ZYMTR|nr:unnamed protein product [Zymoseptoria tritici ST99CH_1E4]